MPTIAKVAPHDYPDLLAAAEAGVSERELARRYGCAPSLIHRHLAKARRLRELCAFKEEAEACPRRGPVEGSTREILEARIRDPQTPSRDLASLVNALARLGGEDEQGAGSATVPFRPGTLVLEPGRGPKSERNYRLLLHEPGGIKHVSSRGYDLTAADAFYLIACWLQSDLGLPLEALGLASENGVVVARRD
jgi:hypothetical protein